MKIEYKIMGIVLVVSVISYMMVAVLLGISGDSYEAYEMVGLYFVFATIFVLLGGLFLD